MAFSRRTFIIVVLCIMIIALLVHHKDTSFSTTFSRIPQGLRQRVGLGEWYSDPGVDDPAQAAMYIPRPTYIPGTAKKPGDSYNRVLIVVTTKDADIKWMDEEIPEVKRVVYVADDPSAEFHPPRNKGHEVINYLTYIIDHYDDLPDVMMFMHSHRWAWHNNDILNRDAMQMIKRLSNERVSREGYMNMRCQWFPGCPDWMHPGETEVDTKKTEQHIIARAWAELFPFDAVPKVLAQSCCAQFALSRDRVRARARHEYVAYRDWILKTKLNDFSSGRVWEYLWQYVFTGKSFWCPAEHVCYCDGYGICFGGKQQYDSWWDLRRKRFSLDADLSHWQDRRKELEEALKEATPDTERIEELRSQAPEEKGPEIKDMIEKADAELNDRAVKAVYRGNDPRNRAMEAGRDWKEGDGF